jgi:hypothetical protein
MINGFVNPIVFLPAVSIQTRSNCSARTITIAGRLVSARSRSIELESRQSGWDAKTVKPHAQNCTYYIGAADYPRFGNTLRSRRAAISDK